MGNFFKKLQQEYSKNNKVYKIGLNKGDEFFSHKNNFFPYKGSPYAWREFIKNFLDKQSINVIFLFGDCRFYHKIAVEESRKFKIDIYVFEEGYIRPNFITLEKNGVNYYSEIPKLKLDFERLRDDIKFVSEKKNFLKRNYIFLKMIIQSGLYYGISNIFSFQYPLYKHHRDFSILKEFKILIVNLYRILKYRIYEFNFEKKLLKKYPKKYYFVPLQTSSDFQVKVHSDFHSIEDFIKQVLTSFAKYAPNDKFIFFKHHPIDRGRLNYKDIIEKYSSELNIKSRVKILYDVHLPTLLRNAIGTVVINSTVGFSSIFHNTPVICLGRSIYNIEGLTAKNTKIDQFWTKNLKIDKIKYKKFRSYLIKKTQINTNFYS